MNHLLLIGFSFLGGLVSSFSPCCLSMLPVNLSYIGSQSFTNRKDAVVKASTFVIGAATTLSMLGLFSSLATFALVQYRSYLLLVVGMIIILMGLSLLNLIYIPFSRMGVNFLPKGLGPFGVGLTFGLVGSPCASPIMLSILTAAASTGSQLISVMAMSSYALGHSLLIFICCLSVGMAKQAKKVGRHSKLVSKLVGVFLVGMGLFYLGTGLYLSVIRFLP